MPRAGRQPSADGGRIRRSLIRSTILTREP
jgi:hypothetical protein